VALWAARASVLCWAIGLLATVAELLLRPPCPPGAVRLIDVGPILPAIPAIGVVVGVPALLRARRPGRHPVVATVSCISVALALPFVLAMVAGIFANLGAEYDTSCWSF
jgi:hypothetical protein